MLLINFFHIIIVCFLFFYFIIDNMLVENI